MTDLQIDKNWCTKSSDSMAELTAYLQQEQATNAKEPWNKLSLMSKRDKLTQFAHTYIHTHNLAANQAPILIQVLFDALDRKCLLRVKDVVYNKDIGEIKSVPALLYDKSRTHFTLSNADRRQSTSKHLGGTRRNLKLLETTPIAEKPVKKRKSASSAAVVATMNDTQQP